jgi:hypothetical protein
MTSQELLHVGHRSTKAHDIGVDPPAAAFGKKLLAKHI